MKVFKAYDEQYDRTFYLTVCLDTHDKKYRIYNLTGHTIWDRYYDTVEEAENMIRHTNFSIEEYISDYFKGINY